MVIQMARSLNNSYLVLLTDVFPAHRKGPLGDVAKINCETCHQGAYKPYFGESMAKAYPELQGSKPVLAEAPAPVDAQDAAAPASTKLVVAPVATPNVGPATVAAAGTRRSSSGGGR